MSCALETGRQHQIRIHLSEAGTPIVGERVYVRDHSGTLVDASRPMLHAQVLELVHPTSSELLRFEVAPPRDFAEMLVHLRRIAATT